MCSIKQESTLKDEEKENLVSDHIKSRYNMNINWSHQPFSRSHYLVGSLVLRDMCWQLCNSTVTHQHSSHSNNKLSCSSCRYSDFTLTTGYSVMFFTTDIVQKNKLTPKKELQTVFSLRQYFAKLAQHFGKLVKQFVKICKKKMLFLVNWTNFNLEAIIMAQELHQFS